MIFALLQAMADEVKANNEASLAEWKQTTLSCTMEFQVMATDDAIAGMALRIREGIVATYTTLSRTPYQRVYEMWNFKKRKEDLQGGKGLTYEQTAAQWNALVGTPAPGSEKVDENYVSACVLVYEKGFKHVSVQKAVGWLDDTFATTNCFDSVLKMQKLIRRCKDAQSVLWCFDSVVDAIRCGKWQVKDFSERKLLGEGGGGKGLVDMWCLKLDMLLHLTRNNPDLKKWGWENQHWSKLLETVYDFQTYRTKLNPYKGKYAEPGVAAKPDLTWQAGWPASMIKYLLLVEEIVYQDDHDATLQTAARSGKLARDVLEYPSLRNRFDSLLKERNQEQTMAKAEKCDDADGGVGVAEPLEACHSLTCGTLNQIDVLD